MHDQIHPRRNGAIGGPRHPRRTTSGLNQDTEQRFRTELLSTSKRTETPGSGKLYVGYGRHRMYQTRDGKEKNTRTDQKRKEKESRLDKLCAESAVVRK